MSKLFIKDHITTDARNKHILVISDVHLGKKIDHKKLNYLLELIAKYDLVVINGDFWDYFYFDFTGFLNSDWNKLFAALKDKQAIYLLGNHDYTDIVDNRAHQFCDQVAISLTLHTKSTEYYVYHGKDLNKMRLQKFLFKLLGRRISQLKPFFYRILYKIFGNKTYLPNKLATEKKAKKLSKNIEATIIMGHAHYAEYNEQLGYINGGFIDIGHASYVEIDKDGVANLKIEKY